MCRSLVIVTGIGSDRVFHCLPKERRGIRLSCEYYSFEHSLLFYTKHLACLSSTLHLLVHTIQTMFNIIMVYGFLFLTVLDQFPVYEAELLIMVDLRTLLNVQLNPGVF